MVSRMLMPPRLFACNMSYWYAHHLKRKTNTACEKERRRKLSYIYDHSISRSHKFWCPVHSKLYGWFVCNGLIVQPSFGSHIGDATGMSLLPCYESECLYIIRMEACYRSCRHPIAPVKAPPPKGCMHRRCTRKMTPWYISLHGISVGTARHCQCIFLGSGVCL